MDTMIITECIDNVNVIFINQLYKYQATVKYIMSDRVTLTFEIPCSYENSG